MITYPKQCSFHELKENELLNFLYNKMGKEVFRPKLLHVELALKRLGLKNNFKIITVGGTNGKGEVCLRVSSYLSQSSINHGLFLSPHCLSITERFSYNGSCIEYDEMLDVFKSIELNCSGIDLSFYEFLFISFLYWVKNKNIDVLVLEVGLGGRLDAVNTLDADITALTSISFDHTEILGETLELILKEKLCITRKGKSLFTTIHQLDLKKQIAAHCFDLDINWFDLVDLDHDFMEKNFSYRNDLLARQIILKLTAKLPTKSDICFKGRGEEKVFFENKIFFYGTHNSDGFKNLINYFESNKEEFDILILSLSKRSEEEISNIIQQIKTTKSFKEIIWANDQHFKKKELVNDDFPNGSALEIIKNIQSKRVLVTGSFYFIGEIQKQMEHVC